MLEYLQKVWQVPSMRDTTTAGKCGSSLPHLIKWGPEESGGERPSAGEPVGCMGISRGERERVEGGERGKKDALHTESTVHAEDAHVVQPRHAELNETLWLNELLRDPRELRVAVEDWGLRQGSGVHDE